MIEKYSLGHYEIVHYYEPGKNLDDISLKKLHCSLVKVNENSGANVVNKMLDKNLSLEEIRYFLGKTIIGLSLKNGEVNGFLVSPILRYEKPAILHSGLIIIERNPGINLISLLVVKHFLMTYEKFGMYYTTNISSTPATLESFTDLIPGAWPGPDMLLKTSPPGYKDIIKILKEEYMDKFFPSPEKLNVDYKRFILTSNSREMGFKTDFHKISRADEFKYNLFCHTWIDYEKEEDVIQVAEVTLYKYLRMQFKFFNLKRNLKKLALVNSKVVENKSLEKHDLKKAA